MIKGREEFKGKVELQVVAFPQDGIAREPGTEELMRQAMELGADISGGIPWMEYTKRRNSPIWILPVIWLKNMTKAYPCSWMM